MSNRIVCILQVGRLLIWAGLSEHMGGVTKLRGHGYKFGRSERGKPMLIDAVGCEVTGIGFNVSHQVLRALVECVLAVHTVNRGTMLFWPPRKGSRVCFTHGI